jgi:preprotein translocase subunit SecG
MTLLLGIFTFILVIVSVFLVLVILAQRAKSDGGVGAALGGGVTEAAFGAESGNVLSRATTYAAVIFFVLSFGLYLGHLHEHRKGLAASDDGLPAMPELNAPAEPGEAATEAPAGETPGAPSVSFPTDTLPEAPAPEDAKEATPDAKEETPAPTP